MQKWEYLTITCANTSWMEPAAPGEAPAYNTQRCPESILNELGDQGWELSGTVGDPGGNYMLFLKRPKG